MGESFNKFEHNSQPLDGSTEQSRETATLANSLWKEIGSKLLGSDKPNAGSTDANTLDFSATDIYPGPRTVADAPPVGSDPTQFVPSERRDAHPNYSGEVILRDVEPIRYTTGKQETLAEIARSHLGAGASPDQIDAHIREVAQLNDIDADAKLPEDYPVDLPGHTSDGGYTTLDSGKRTTWRDGREYVERADGSGYERKVNSASGYTETHWGLEPEDCYELVRAADGRYLISDEPGVPPVEKSDHDDVRVERARLSDLIKSLSDNPKQVENFLGSMRRFEDRATRDEVKPAEIALTYHHLSRLIETEGSTILDLGQRKALSQQIIEQAADPTLIDQGYHNTCNVAVVESRMYTRHPSDAVRLVTDMALAGQFETADKTVIQVSSESLQPHTQSKLDSREDGARSYASQVFQVAAVNAYWQRQTEDSESNQIDVRYEQVDPEGDTDTGERLLNYWGMSPSEQTEKDGTPMRHPNLGINDIWDVYSQITGNNEKNAFLANAETVKNSRVPTFENEDQLQAQLTYLKDAGRLPAVIQVDARNEPFLTDSDDGMEGGSDGWHVVTVTDFDPATDRVSVDNQWGMDADKFGDEALPLEELYLSTWRSTDASHVQAAGDHADEQLKLGNDEHFAELDFLRLQHDADMAGLSPMEKWAKANATSSFAGIVNLGVTIAKMEADDRYDTALAEKVVEIEKRRDMQEAYGTEDEFVAGKVDDKIRNLVMAMPEERQVKVANLVERGLADWHFTAPVDPVRKAADRLWWWDQLQTRE